jgi:predicted enzyme related to lactoylglutathione lyase
MSDRKLLPGKFVWFELVSADAKKAQRFYAEVLGWNTQTFPMGDQTYDMILTGKTPDTMIGGYASPKNGQPAHWISYVSVEDVDRAAKLAKENGGKVIEAPHDIPTVGRSARIADPQGAEICVFKSATGDPPDGAGKAGNFFWNELHTSDPRSALAFYEKVVGFAHRSMDMGPGGAYHIISLDGVDRGGVTHHLPPGMPPHWLPYVHVDDPDATAKRAKQQGATLLMEPEDIAGVGRFAVLKDPVGAVLAVMKPQPRAE